jgi:hypothetical protein
MEVLSTGDVQKKKSSDEGALIQQSHSFSATMHPLSTPPLIFHLTSAFLGSMANEGTFSTNYLQLFVAFIS